MEGKKESKYTYQSSSLFRDAIMRKAIICSPVVPGLEGEWTRPFFNMCLHPDFFNSFGGYLNAAISISNMRSGK